MTGHKGPAGWRWGSAIRGVPSSKSEAWHWLSDGYHRFPSSHHASVRFWLQTIHAHFLPNPSLLTMIVYDELEMTWKETALKCLVVLSQYWSGGAAENHGNLSG